MADGFSEILAESRRGAYSGSLWSGLTDGEAALIWDTMCAMIERSMVQYRRGVVIPAFATVAVSNVSLDVGNNKMVVLRTPVFVLSERFARVHRLLGTATRVPRGECATVVPLNLTQLAVETRLGRDQVYERFF